MTWVIHEWGKPSVVDVTDNISTSPSHTGEQPTEKTLWHSNQPNTKMTQSDDCAKCGRFAKVVTRL